MQPYRASSQAKQWLGVMPCSLFVLTGISLAPHPNPGNRRCTPSGRRSRTIGNSEHTTGEPQSISRLTSGTRLTRQAVTKHLRVLEDAGVVRSVRVGRESRFDLELKPIEDVRRYLEQVSRQWDDALARLKSIVEDR